VAVQPQYNAAGCWECLQFYKKLSHIEFIVLLAALIA